MNFCLGGTICLAHVRGHINTQTKHSCVINLAQYIHVYIYVAKIVFISIVDSTVSQTLSI